MPNNYPLEEFLETNSLNQNQKFPYSNTNYYERYRAFKDYIFDSYAKWVNPAMTDDDSFYTDHGPDHINAVIRQAGRLFGLEQEKLETNTITPYEAFLILCAILIHDAGNVISREGHERRAAAILKETGAGLFSDRDERNVIARIAKAHSGKFNNTNDTLADDALVEDATYLNIHYRPKMLAAILRFADEISEDRSRTAVFLNEQNILRGSKVYHDYAASISSCEFKPNEKCIKIRYIIDKSQLDDIYTDKLGEFHLIDEIFRRLHKMNLERMYCMRYMGEVCNIREIKAEIEIVAEDKNFELETLDSLALRYKDSGYPSERDAEKERYPDWSGKELRKRHGTVEEAI